MKYINEWFSPEDFINLMRDKSDRTIILKQVVVYIDDKTQKVFERDSVGKILEKPSDIEGRSLDMVVSFQDGLSMTEEKVQGKTLKEEIWEDFANWYKQHKSD